ncbi:MAG TPA: hypothetical protein VJ652_04385 [Noviherbaspirillum sp.]|nr:hypothetical protein [Noviherbaspirillum sp.]
MEIRPARTSGFAPRIVCVLVREARREAGTEFVRHCRPMRQKRLLHEVFAQRKNVILQDATLNASARTSACGSQQAARKNTAQAVHRAAFFRLLVLLACPLPFAIACITTAWNAGTLFRCGSC